MSPKFLLLVFHVCGKTSFYFFLCGKTFLQKDRKTSIFFLCEFFFFLCVNTCAEKLLSIFSRVRKDF